MADFNQPALTSLYTDMVDTLKARDVDGLKWLDGTTSTNVPSGAKRWNSTNNYFEKYNGTAWVPLATKYIIDVDKVDGCTVNDLGVSATDLWSASKTTNELNAKLNASSYTPADVLTKIKTVDGAASGLDADLLDGMHAGSTNTASTIVSRDASGNFSAGTITATLNGNATTATTAGTCTGNAATATTATKSSTLAQGGGIGPAMTFTWAGQSGQPPWLWGGTDGANMYVYNPSEFLVKGFNSSAIRLEYCYGTGGNSSNLALGTSALLTNTTGYHNTAIGTRSLANTTTGFNNVAIGYESMVNTTTGFSNVAIGDSNLVYNTTGDSNVAIGAAALWYNTTGDDNIAIGRAALRDNTIGFTNVAIGNSALIQSTSNGNTALGHQALFNVVNYSNCTGLGYNAQVTGSNQVQIGSSTTTTYVYGTVQNRSDARDKTEIKDTVLGLEFIKKIRPVEYKWDMRDFYYDNIEVEEEVERTREIPAVLDAKGNVITKARTETYKELEKVINKVEVPKDGSRARGRFHQGVIAQEVKQVIDELGYDFGGYQDHSVGGGKDVLSIGYDEFIGPLIKAIQEQQVIIDNLSSRLEALENK